MTQPRYPSLSVVMPNYNHGSVIAQALGALLSQSPPPLEIIVVDDASTDESVAAIEKLARNNPSIRLIRNPRNLGSNAALAAGFEHARGDCVYFAGADDFVLPGFCEKLLGALARHPEAGLAYCDYRAADGREYRFHWSEKTSYFPPEEMTRRLMRARYFPAAGCNAVVRRAAFLEVGFLPELRWGMDVFQMMVVAVRYGLCYVPEPLMTIRDNPKSYSAKGRVNAAAQEDVFNSLFTILNSAKFEDFRRWIQRTAILPFVHARMLKLILGRRENWGYFSLALLRDILWYGLKDRLSPKLPLAVKKLYGRARNAYRQALLGKSIPHAILSAIKYRLCAPLPARWYWHLMGRFKPVGAVTSQYETIEDCLASGQDVVRVLEKLGVVAPDAVTLQIGSGLGRVEKHLSAKAALCYGVDISPSMIEQARKLVDAPNVEFVLNEGRGLGFWKDGSLDLVYSFLVFQHLPRTWVKEYLGEAFAKLKPGGHVVFQMMIDEAAETSEPPVNHPYGLRRYRRREVEEMLQERGFGDVRIYDAAGEPDRGQDFGDAVFKARKPAAP